MTCEKKIGVYLIHNADTGEFYAGSGNLTQRRQKHMRDLENGKEEKKREDGTLMKHGNFKLQRAYNKNPNFQFFGVELDTREEAYACEQDIIDRFMGDSKFLNISTDVRAGSYEITEEIRAKLKARVMSPEARRKIAEAQRGKSPSEETRRKISESNKGKVVSEETHEKLSNRPVQIVTEETRAKMRAAHLDPVFTEEHKKKISEKTKQQWNDPNFRNLMKEANGAKVRIHGVTYPSASEAARELKMSLTGILYRLDNPRQPEYVRL